jgi:hypothetical protein
MMLRGIKSMIFEEILPLHHAEGNQISPLHHAKGDGVTLCFIVQWGVIEKILATSFHCMMGR